MKSLVWLTESVLRDCGTMCGADTTKDIETVRRRVEYEGESFLTLTLPLFAGAFDLALASGVLEPSAVSHFRWHRRGLPEFLRGFLLLIFDTKGLLLPDPSVQAIYCVRQICLLHKKVLRDCTPKREAAAIAKFRKTDDELARPSTSPDTDDRLDKAFSFVSGVVWSSILRGAPFGDPTDELHPAHGPGATAERVSGNAKYVFQRWHSRLEEHFPFTEYAIGSLRDVGGEACPLARVEFVEPGDEQPVKVTLVPKTLKTPRVIAIEPVCMQFVQQGILRWLVPLIERGTYTGGRVNFSDQSINARLALKSSVSGRYATLDLSDASDRVSSELVWQMLAVAPGFRDQVFACRSTRAKLPDGDVIPLKKFASMGSALCFPMEAMVFFCTVVARRMLRAGMTLRARNVRKASRRVYVYGDDIIVPTDEAPDACGALEAFGLKVNSRKSFWTGRFRESCGTDAFAGTDVTPVYVRHLPPDSVRDAEATVSWVSMGNQFYMAGLWKTADAVRAHVEKRVGRLPLRPEGSEGLGWVTLQQVSQHRRWNKDLMRFEVRTLVPTPRRSVSVLDGDAALLKCFGLISGSWQWLAAGAEGAADHLQSIVARGRLALKARWVAA
jgi:hypothetical protein